MTAEKPLTLTQALEYPDGTLFEITHAHYGFTHLKGKICVKTEDDNPRTRERGDVLGISVFEPHEKTYYRLGSKNGWGFRQVTQHP